MIDTSKLDWAKYFGPQRNPQPAAAGTFGDNLNLTPTGLPGVAGASGASGVTGDMTLPADWTKASDYWTKLLGGGGGAGAPSIWNDVLSRLKGLSATGEPTDISGWWESQKPIYEQQMSDQTKQLLEGGNLTRTRWSTPMIRNIADMVQRGQTSLTGQAMGMQMNADEAAKQRILEALGLMGNIGGQQAAMNQFNAQNKMNAAGNLFGAGQGEANLGLNLAQLMNMFDQQQNNPAWLQSALGALGQSGGGYQTQYQPSFWEQLAGAAGNIPALIGAFSGNKNTGTPNTAYGWV